MVYLGTAITSGNDTSLEIKRRSTFAKRILPPTQMKTRVLSRKTKVTLYKTLIMSVLLNGVEGWVLSQYDYSALDVYEIKNPAQDLQSSTNWRRIPYPNEPRNI